MDFLLNVAVVRPVFMWGAPGIGKSALVRRFAAAVGIECVSLLGSQLAPEDLIGIPKIDGECSHFYPPASIGEQMIEALAFGLLTPAHAGHFKAFLKQIHQKHALHAILKGDAFWPIGPENRDVLYFLAQSLRAHLRKELPDDDASLRSAHHDLAIRAKDLLRDLARISVEIAQSVLSEDEAGRRLPA